MTVPIISRTANREEVRRYLSTPFNTVMVEDGRSVQNQTVDNDVAFALYGDIDDGGRHLRDVDNIDDALNWLFK